MRTRTDLGPITLLLAALLTPLPAAAQSSDQERTLHWDELRVEAHLDADGRLHLREHHGMVFDGAWNGGEREFEARLGQRARLEGIARVDASGAPLPLVEDDDLEEVDQYDRDGSTVRWRSRLPDDPPFEGERIDYVLEYTLSNAVVPTEDGYVLAHDFLPAERSGPVERFSLSLTIDSAWTPTGTFPGTWAAADIAPGLGFAIRVPLDYEDAARPLTVPEPPSTLYRGVLILLLVGGAAMLFLRFFRREQASGRYAPLPRVEGEDWLRDHVFDLPAEVVGAAWDRTTSAPEVAGLLARLVQEGKLRSRVDPEPEEGGEPVLHLELRTDRDAFAPYERNLIDALFFDGRTETDTAAIKEHYEDSGFDPASRISSALEERVDALAGGGMVPRRQGTVFGALGIGTALLITAVVVRPTDALPAVLGFLCMVFVGAVVISVAASYSLRVTGLRNRAIGFSVPALLVLAGVATFIGGGLETATVGEGGLSPFYHPGPLLLLALAVLGLTLVHAVLQTARPTDTPQRLELRRRLAAAEAHFRAELARPDPALRDEWFPYLLAFGLGESIDHWFSAYAPAGASTTGQAAVIAASTAAGASSGSSSGASGSGGTGGAATFGGGGGFSGGGVGASWGAAAATIATGVSAPSSGTAGGAASSAGAAGGW